MPLDTGAYSGAPSHSSVSSHAHGAAPAHVSDAVRRSRSRSPTTLFWAPRASEDVLRSGDGTSWHSPGPMGSQGRELKTEDGFIDAESIDGGLLRGGDAVADPTADPVFPGVDSEDRCESASRLISASISTSRATERLSVESGEGYKPLPPLPLPLPSSPSLIAADSGFVRFPTSGVDMPKQYSVHDADAGTEYSETGRTEFFDALSDVGSDSTIRGGYVRVDPDVLKGYRDRAQGPPGGWPEERASTYGFVHAGVERDRKGSAATITGTGRQRVVSSLAPAKRLSMASQKEGAQASGGAPASRARRESATPSMASARPSAASPVTSRMRKDSLSVTKPAPAPQSQSSRSSVATPVPPASQRASCASASTEKDRGSHVPVSVRASTGPHQRNTFGVQSPAPPPKDRFSSSKLSIPGRERKESISHITSDSVSASATASIAIDTTVNYNHNNASSSRQSSPSTPHSTSGGSSSSTSPPPIPPRSGRRPSYDSGRRAGGAAAIDREKDRTGSVVGVGDSSSSASPAGTTPATTPQREEDMPMLVAASVSVHTAPGLKSPLLSESVKRPAHSRTRSASVSRGNAKYYGEVTQDPLASPSGSPTPPTSGAVRAFVFSPGDAERGRVSYDSFSTNGTGAGGALGKKNGSAFTGLWQYDSEQWSWRGRA
ncbi:hypothetical protein OE88DRAFT_1377991 [Heliocybe sulcata]|uniref:Uncharacterized protein n=1 Tax=Heliocybe sulcata TaxID=5364 RepID=A0A5C3N4C1_9AGAM|nr:hypothetical protein OE88DRAFT_1377991 [Heliocybe sulcata]